LYLFRKPIGIYSSVQKEKVSGENTFPILKLLIYWPGRCSLAACRHQWKQEYPNKQSHKKGCYCYHASSSIHS